MIHKVLQLSIYPSYSPPSHHSRHFSDLHSTDLTPFTHHTAATPAFLLFLEYVIIPHTLPVSLCTCSLSQKLFFMWLTLFTLPDTFLTTLYKIQLPSLTTPLLSNIFLHLYLYHLRYYKFVNFCSPVIREVHEVKNLGLFCFPLNIKHLKQCLEHGKPSVNIC